MSIVASQGLVASNASTNVAASIAANVAAKPPETPRVRDWELPFAVDVRIALSVHGRGRGDPTFRIDEAGAVWRTSLTPDGPATIRVMTPARASQIAGVPVRAQA